MTNVSHPSTRALPEADRRPFIRQRDGGATRRAARRRAPQAQRVVDLLGFFEDRTEATLQEISSFFGWPQSSTSDLLAALVAAGLFYRKLGSRLYRPTPRAAWLGWHAQPAVVRSGQLDRAMRSLAAQTGCSSAVIGKVGLDAQIFAWTPGGADEPAPLQPGANTRLHQSAAGRLLLSTLGDEVWPRVLHRLRAEAPPELKFDLAAVADEVATCRRHGNTWGAAGFDTSLHLCGALAPGTPADQPLVLAVLFDPMSAFPLEILSKVLAVLQEDLETGSDAA